MCLAKPFPNLVFFVCCFKRKIDDKGDSSTSRLTESPRLCVSCRHLGFLTLIIGKICSEQRAVWVP